MLAFHLPTTVDKEPLLGGYKTLRERVNRKRFQSRQDFGAFFNILCYWAVTVYQKKSVDKIVSKKKRANALTNFLPLLYTFSFLSINKINQNQKQTNSNRWETLEVVDWANDFVSLNLAKTFCFWCSLSIILLYLLQTW